MKYIILMLLSSFLSFCKGLYLPKLLTLSEYGVYSFYSQWVSVVIPVLSLGLVDSFFLKYRKLSRFKTSMNKYYSSLFMSIFIIHFLFILFTFFLFLLFKYSVHTEYFLIYVSLSSIIQFVFFWLMKTLRFRLDENKFAFYLFFRVFLDLSVLLLFDADSFFDVILSEFFSFIVVILFIYFREDSDFIFSKFLSFNAFKRLFFSGFPILLNVLFVNCILFADKIFVGVYFSKHEIGSYNLTFLPMLIAIMIYNIFFQYFVPYFNSIYKASVSPLSFFLTYRFYYLFYVFLCFILCVIFYFLFPIIFQYFYNFDVDYNVFIFVLLCVFLYLINIFDVLYLVCGISIVQLKIYTFSSFLLLFLLFTCSFFNYNMQYVSFISFFIRFVVLFLSFFGLYFVTKKNY